MQVGDFHQSGVISTLHQLGRPDRPRLEEELGRFAQSRPLALILPALASEMDGPALPGIIDELVGARYINEIIISLGRAGRKDLERAREFFSVLPQDYLILNNEGKSIQRLLAELKQHGISVGQEGKGRAVWMAVGVVLARGTSRCLALHDCDIIDYDRMLLGRLAYPLMNPHLDYEFCKGYYARVTHRMYGRVTRLFVAPLIQSSIRLLGPLPYLRFMESFRYPLAGEFAMDMDLARLNRIPANWGLEVGVLGEVFRNLSPRRVCQVDLTDAYEHKHQELSSGDPDKGLLKMCTDIGQTLLRGLAAEGAVIHKGILDSLMVAYRRIAQDMVSSYGADAALNGLEFDRHQEELAVETFGKGLGLAMEKYLADPTGATQLSNWNRVASAVPDILSRLLTAVQEDNS